MTKRGSRKLTKRTSNIKKLSEPHHYPYHNYSTNDILPITCSENSLIIAATNGRNAPQKPTPRVISFQICLNIFNPVTNLFGSEFDLAKLDCVIMTQAVVWLPPCLYNARLYTNRVKSLALLGYSWREFY